MPRSRGAQTREGLELRRGLKKVWRRKLEKGFAAEGAKLRWHLGEEAPERLRLLADGLVLAARPLQQLLEGRHRHEMCLPAASVFREAATVAKFGQAWLKRL